MYTEYDKAIAALLTALLGVLTAFNVDPAWLSPAIVAAITPFVTAIVVWLVPNAAKPVPPPPAKQEP